MTVHVHATGLVAQWDTFANLLTSENNYVDVGVWACWFLVTKRFMFSAATQNLNVKILGSLDGGATYPIEVLGETAVAAAATVTPNAITDWYSHLKVQVAPAVAATHGTLSTAYGGGSF